MWMILKVFHSLCIFMEHLCLQMGEMFILTGYYMSAESISNLALITTLANIAQLNPTKISCF